jgi:Predicted transcriptional regulators
MPENTLYQNYITELRRGSLTMAVLGCLKKPYYGYALLQALQENGVDIEANTLYPLLRRLESQGLLTSDWNVSESRPRKYYTMVKKGEEVLAELLTEWQKMQRSIQQICGEQ